MNSLMVGHLLTELLTSVRDVCGSSLKAGILNVLDSGLFHETYCVYEMTFKHFRGRTEGLIITVAELLLS